MQVTVCSNAEQFDFEADDDDADDDAADDVATDVGLLANLYLLDLANIIE